jgi:hypothetical protein
VDRRGSCRPASRRRSRWLFPTPRDRCRLTAVRLTGGPLKRAQDLDTAYLLSLDPDRMLAFYRKDSRRQLRSERPVVTVVHAAQDLRRPARCVSPHR